MAQVSIVRLEDKRTEELAYLETVVDEAVQLIGGWSRYIKPGDRVFIKANEFIARTLESGFITNPLLVIAVAKAARAAGAAQVTVGEHCATIYHCFAPYPEIYNYAEVVALQELPHTHRLIPGAKSLRFTVAWPDIVHDCDVFINMPGLRTHALPLMSNAMKNLMGLLPLGGTKSVHMYGLAGSIVDLNHFRPSDLVITDAIYSIEGNFPSEGEAIKTNLIMAADNVVAADVVAAPLLGFDPKEIPYVREGAERGLGPIELAEIEVKGERLEDVCRSITFTKAPSDYTPFKEYFAILDRGACSACRQALAGGLTAASHKPGFEQIKDLSIVLGPFEAEPQVETSKVILYGNCTYRWRHLGTHVEGCPPLSGQACTAILGAKKQPIKFSICSLGTKTEKIEEIIPHVASLGYHGIEIWGNHLEDYLERQGSLASLRSLLDHYGLAVPLLTPYFNFIGTPAEYQESIDRAKRFVRYAQALAVPYVRVFVGPVASADASHAQWRQVVAALKEITQIGQQAGVGFALETHQGQLMDTVKSTIRILHQVDAANLKVNLDIHNLFDMGEDPIAALKQLLPYTVHIHAKNGRIEEGKRRYGIPLAEQGNPGNMNYREFFQALKACGYNHFVSIEWFGDNFWEAAKSELVFLQRELV